MFFFIGNPQRCLEIEHLLYHTHTMSQVLQMYLDTAGVPEDTVLYTAHAGPTSSQRWWDNNVPLDQLWRQSKNFSSNSQRTHQVQSPTEAPQRLSCPPPSSARGHLLWGISQLILWKKEINAILMMHNKSSMEWSLTLISEWFTPLTLTLSSSIKGNKYQLQERGGLAYTSAPSLLEMVAFNCQVQIALF